jgi:hypothetical protein
VHGPRPRGRLAAQGDEVGQRGLEEQAGVQALRVELDVVEADGGLDLERELVDGQARDIQKQVGVLGPIRRGRSAGDRGRPRVGGGGPNLRRRGASGGRDRAAIVPRLDSADVGAGPRRLGPRDRARPLGAVVPRRPALGLRPYDGFVLLRHVGPPGGGSSEGGGTISFGKQSPLRIPKLNDVVNLSV